ncbi:MAG: SDR family NAD(P)-dependent oxidoreductase [bacterium]
MRAKDPAQDIIEEIKKNGAHAAAFKADVFNEEQVHDMFAHMIIEFGTIDILIFI